LNFIALIYFEISVFPDMIVLEID